MAETKKCDHCSRDINVSYGVHNQQFPLRLTVALSSRHGKHVGSKRRRKGGRKR